MGMSQPMASGQVLTKVEGKKPTQRLMAAINYLEDDALTQQDVAQRYGYTGAWLSQWLDRFERLADEPFEDVVYDEHRSGRSAELSETDREQFEAVLHESPEEAGIDAPAWTVPLARQYLIDTFDVEYCLRHVRRLMTEAGLSSKTARPKYEKADERAQEAWQDGFKKSGAIWTTSTRS